MVADHARFTFSRKMQRTHSMTFGGRKIFAGDKIDPFITEVFWFDIFSIWEIVKVKIQIFFSVSKTPRSTSFFARTTRRKGCIGVNCRAVKCLKTRARALKRTRVFIGFNSLLTARKQSNTLRIDSTRQSRYLEYLFWKFPALTTKTRSPCAYHSLWRHYA